MKTILATTAALAPIASKASEQPLPLETLSPAPIEQVERPNPQELEQDLACALSINGINPQRSIEFHGKPTYYNPETETLHDLSNFPSHTRQSTYFPAGRAPTHNGAPTLTAYSKEKLKEVLAASPTLPLTTRAKSVLFLGEGLGLNLGITEDQQLYLTTRNGTNHLISLELEEALQQLYQSRDALSPLRFRIAAQIEQAAINSPETNPAREPLKPALSLEVHPADLSSYIRYHFQKAEQEHSFSLPSVEGDPELVFVSPENLTIAFRTLQDTLRSMQQSDSEIGEEVSTRVRELYQKASAANLKSELYVVVACLQGDTIVTETGSLITRSTQGKIDESR